MSAALTPGRVVYVFARETLRPGRVLSVHGGRVEVAHPDGEIAAYPDKRLAHVSGHAVPTDAALEAWVDLVADHQADIDLPALWEAVSEDGGARTVEQLAGLALPAGDAASDAMARALFQDGVYFKRKKKGGKYLPNGSRVVSDRLREQEERRRAEEDFARMVDWLRDPDVPDVDSADGVVVVRTLSHVALFDEPTGVGKLGRRLIAAAFEDEDDEPKWIAWRVLRRLGIWTEHENLALRRTGLRTAFPEPVLDDAATLASKAPTGWSDREDLRDLEAVAIDDRWTTEIDDALAVESRPGGAWTAWVFITDVAHHVPRDSPTDLEARKRSSTVYIPDRRVPMLPEVLADGAASLQPGHDRPVIGYALHVDADGMLRDVAIERAVIRVTASVTYVEAEAAIAGADHPQGDTIRQLSAIADGLRRARMDGGSITLDRQEISVHVEDEVPHLQTYRTDDRSRRLVSEFMIQVCHQTARWCRDRDIPTLYRAQPEPHPRPVVPRDRRLRPHELQRAMKNMRKAELTTVADGHAALGVDCYTQISSPLRRYADLVQQRQIVAHLTGSPGYTTEELHALIVELVELRGAIGQVERESRRYWILRALQARAGGTVDVEIVRRIGNRRLVEVLGYCLTVLLKLEIDVGRRLPMRITHVDPRRDQLVLSP